MAAVRVDTARLLRYLTTRTKCGAACRVPCVVLTHLPHDNGAIARAAKCALPDSLPAAQPAHWWAILNAHAFIERAFSVVNADLRYTAGANNNDDLDHSSARLRAR